MPLNMPRKKKQLKEDPKKIKEALKNGEIDIAEPLRWAFMGDLIRFCEKVGVLDILNEATGSFKRKSIDIMGKYLLIYIIKLFVGITTIRGIKELLSDYGVMKLLGFNHDVISSGITNRGIANQYGNKHQRKSGIMDCFTILDNVAKFTLSSLIKCHRKIIRELVRIGIPFGDKYALDSTIIHTPESYPGAVMTSRKENDTKIKIWGFKLFILYDIKTRIPVAIEVVTAEKADPKYFLSIVQQGEENLGKNKIKLVVADKGFLDGSTMWKLKFEKGIDFVVPAKAQMIVWEDAIAFREAAEKAKMIETWKYGKGDSGGYLVPGLKSYSEYNKEPVKSKKYCNGQAINAVVVTMWRGKQISSGKEKVLLTSLAGSSAIEVVKNYRLRSYIENCGFRELKQAAMLSKLPKRNSKNAENAAYSHIVLCVIAFVIFYAFILWRKERRRSKAQLKSDSIHLREFRKQTKYFTNPIFIAHERYYAILTFDEVLDAVGIRQTLKTNINVAKQ